MLWFIKRSTDYFISRYFIDFWHEKIKKCWFRSPHSSEGFQKAMKEDEKVKDAEFQSIDNEQLLQKRKYKRERTGLIRV